MTKKVKDKLTITKFKLDYVHIKGHKASNLKGTMHVHFMSKGDDQRGRDSVDLELTDEEKNMLVARIQARLDKLETDTGWTNLT
jgi:hypothetical protein